MTTHAHGRLPFPRSANTWYRRLRNARVRGSFTPADKELAASWQSCAIGERFNVPRNNTVETRRIIKETGRGQQEVEALISAGIDFLFGVSDNDVDRAFSAYTKIHRRR